jgi:hypothetical protein
LDVRQIVAPDLRRDAADSRTAATAETCMLKLAIDIAAIVDGIDLEHALTQLPAR